jgi:hypothetical protein
VHGKLRQHRQYNSGMYCSLRQMNLNVYVVFVAVLTVNYI